MCISKDLLFLFFLILLIGCAKNETPIPTPDISEQPNPEPKPEERKEPEEEIYFSYYLDPYIYDADWADWWVILHDQNGELLDYRLIKQGDSLDFKGSVEKLSRIKTLSITTLNYRPKDEGGDFHLINTTTGIAKGSIWGWTYEAEPYIPNPPVGQQQYQLSIEVQNVPNVKRFSLASLLDSYLAGHPFYLETNTLQVGSPFLQRNLDYLLELRDGNDEVKYLIFNLEDPNSNITLDYVDFLEYDHIIEVELPEHIGYSANVFAKNKSENYISGLRISSDGAGRIARTKAKLGYINSFDTFYTDFHLEYSADVRYNFYKIGSRPTDINVPTGLDFQVQHDDIYSYSFTTNQPYFRFISSWIYENLDNNHTTRFGLSGKSVDGLMLGELPEEILEKHPNLNINGLTYESTALYIGENVDFTSDNRTSYGGFWTITSSERLIFKNTEE